jgi:hypothetical protein
MNLTTEGGKIGSTDLTAFSCQIHSSGEPENRGWEFLSTSGKIESIGCRAVVNTLDDTLSGEIVSLDFFIRSERL